MPCERPALTAVPLCNWSVALVLPHFGSASLEVASRWEGPQLVSEQDLGSGRLVRSTYSIVPTTKQLLVRVTIDRTAGFPGPFQIRLVYNRAS